MLDFKGIENPAADFFSGLGFHMSCAETASKAHASGFTRHHPATFFPRPQLDWDRGCLKSHSNPANFALYLE